ncbi:hypothetical protein [Streptomyces sp. NPDC093990]|uniref:hypothetical protein n=1 Tax=Streptomyces sp. NPDC093990 TaxID=3155306 RepID=UPI0034262C56
MLVTGCEVFSDGHMDFCRMAECAVEVEVEVEGVAGASSVACAAEVASLFEVGDGAQGIDGPGETLVCPWSGWSAAAVPSAVP